MGHREARAADVSGPYQVMPAMPAEEYRRLRESIRAHGVLVPVTVDEVGNTLDGHHRLAVCSELGISTYPRVVRAGMSEDQKFEYVIAVNLLRRHLSAADRRRWIRELSDRGWSGRRIAAETRIPATTVRRALKEAGAPNGAPAEGRVVGIDGKRYPARPRVTSTVVTTNHQQGRATAALAAIPSEDRPASMTTLGRLERLARTANRRASLDVLAGPELPATLNVVHADFRDIEVQDRSVDLIVTDPPYRAQDIPIFGELGAFALRVLRPGSFLACYAGGMELPEEINLLGKYLDFHWLLVSPFASGDVRQVRQRHLGSAYRPILLFRAPGGTADPPWLIDLLGRGRERRAREKDLHNWQQPEAEAGELIESLSRPGDLVVDPFLGSGTTAVAAASLGRRFIGSEIEKSTHHVARARLQARLLEVDQPIASEHQLDARVLEV